MDITLEKMQKKIKYVNLKRFDRGWGTVVVSLVQGRYVVRAFGISRSLDTPLLLNFEKAYEVVSELENVEFTKSMLMKVWN